ncbi:ribonuclease H-like domain-containing protein [Tanacetum coccineum]
MHIEEVMGVNFKHGDDYVEDPVTLISKLDISDPQHLHPNDSTALTIMILICKLEAIFSLEKSYMMLEVPMLPSLVRNLTELLLVVLLVPLKGIRLLLLKGGGSGLVCENSGFNGHTIERCFKIIGYPVGFGKKKQGQNFKGKNVSNNNYVGTSSSSRLTNEQMVTLISLTKDNKVGKNVQANMAGANQHMTYIDKELDNVLDISHLKIKVGHPNRTKAFISKIGNLKLSNDLILYDVLVIPEYCVTLISVHKLVKENKIIVSFDENRCYFLNQDLNLKHVMGIGDLVHLDFWGPYKVTSSEGFRYFLTVVDDYTRAVWVYLVISKDEGIIHQTSCAYTLQQNEIAERKRRHLLNVARSLLFQGGIPLRMWTKYILTTTYLINRLPSSVLNGKSPYEMIYKKHPSLSHLRVFGCLCFATIVNINDKFGSRFEKSVMIGVF